MKYAAKKTWPEKSNVWDHQGESDSLESFALEFATIEQLNFNNEFVIIEKKENIHNAHFFRVTGSAPYQVISIDQGDTHDIAEPTTVEIKQKQTADFTLDFSPAISMLIYMTKVGLTATIIIAILGVIITYIRRSIIS